ncbi:MAG: SusC/RagA family TonB-linked outer membrane protein [Flavobacteriaceae bacterium]
MKNKLLTKLLFLPLFFLMGGYAFAQITVGGNVSDANGPVPGVNVIVKGTSNGAQTDFDGNYSLNDVASNAVLVYSYIGYVTQEVAVGGRTNINVTLQEDVESLAEVVVIGYGTTTVKDATGAVTAVTSEDFNKGIITSPEQLIQGKAAGVQISQSSGEPGAGVAIRIRGTNSVRANNNPLFVIDGIPLSGGNTTASSADTGGFGTNPSKNPLNFLNPNDIESISILKDASATAIYGSRGSNGVVIITTKSGKGNRGGVWEVSSNLSISSLRERYDLLSAEDYLLYSEAAGFDANARNKRSRTDWQDVIFRTSASTQNDVSYSNSYSTGDVRASFGYTKNFGILENTSLERINGRFNISQRFLQNKLKLNFNGTVSRVNDETTATGGGAGFRGDIIGAAVAANPTWPADPDFVNTDGLFNPLSLLQYTQNHSNTNRYLLNLSLAYDILPELTAKVNLGYDTSDSRRIAVASRDGENLQNGVFENGRGTLNDLDLESKLMEITLNYKKDFGNISLDVLGGFSYQDFNTKGKNVNAFGFFTSELNEMGEAIESSIDALESRISGDYQQYGFSNNYNGDFNPNSGQIFVNRLFPDIATDFLTGAVGNLGVESLTADTFDNTDELQSFFGRVNVGISDKYLFTATVRADGSTRFGANNKYGYFPSGAFAWKINEEGFLGDNVSTLKLRLNAGVTGNQEGLGYGNSIRRRKFGAPGIDNNGAITIPQETNVSFGNDDLKWEENLQFGAGLDFGFNNDRLNGSIDYYRKTTKDLLFNVQSSQPAPQPFVFFNLPDSEVLNQGIEFALNYDIVQNDNFTWNAGFNVTYNKNEITSLTGIYESGTINGQGLTGAFAQAFEQGQPLFSFYLREFEGFDPATGQPIQEDVQKFVGKSALPDFVGGFSTSVSYKNWSLSTFLSGQFGHYVYNNTTNAFFTAGSFGSARNVPYSTVGDINAISVNTQDNYAILGNGEATNAAAEVSTRFLEKGDFIRLENVSLSYNWPLKDDAFFKSITLTAIGQNLFLITDYSGLDPEVNSAAAAGDGNIRNGLPTAGIDFGAYPRPKTYTFGFSAKF